LIGPSTPTTITTAANAASKQTIGWLSSSREAARIVSEYRIMLCPSLSVADSVRRCSTDKRRKPMADS
jgi:hypothetical protein